MDPIFIVAGLLGIVAGLLGVATDTDTIARDIVLRLHAESIERRDEREQPRRWRRGRVLAQVIEIEGRGFREPNTVAANRRE